MPKNFLVGIGGSGAKVTESALYLCASGFGPQKLFLFLIDPDRGNGNLARTTKLMSSYLECKKEFKPHNDVKLFQTELVVPENEKDRVWTVFDKTDTTLSEWIGYDGLNEEKQRDERDMMSVLFSKQELTTKLNMGFRGHPSIGSVVMTELPTNNYPFKLLWDELPEGKAFDVRLFLVGSVFGGTGAAGFPTLGHRNTLKFNKEKGAVINDKEEISRILLGGSLILPYFRVVKNDNQPDMHVTSGDFPIATKAALEFYDTKDSLGFDQVYFIGDSLSQDVGDFSVGSTSQENDPHYIEIVSTLAAFDFFSQPAIEKKEKDTMYFIAKRDNEKLTWNSLPFSRNEEEITNVQKRFKTRITTMTVFSYALVTYGRSVLNPADDGKNKDEFRQPWYQEHFNHNKNDDLINPRTTNNKDFLNKVIDFAENYLHWITSISDYENVELIDKAKFSDGKKKWKNPVNHAIIGELLKETSEKKGWTDSKGGFLQCLNADDINKNISRDTKTFSAANKFLNLFYEGAEKFAKGNYTIN
jgi:hypothetical protein